MNEPNTNLYISKYCSKPEFNCSSCKFKNGGFICKSKREGICIYRKLMKQDGNIITNF